MTWQLWVRGVVMLISATVIVGVGGPALLRDTSPVAEQVRPVASTLTPSASPKTPFMWGAPSATPAAAPSAPVATVLLVRRVTAPVGVEKKGRITLRGELVEAGTGAPVQATVTLWRRTPRNKWKAVLAGRPTSAEGTVLLEVEQAGARSVYRLTFAADGGHLASTSRPLTVKR